MKAKYLYLVLSISLVTSVAHAELQNAATAKDGSQYYIDTDTIITNGSHRTAIIVKVFSDSTPPPIKSITTIQEFDCESQKSRLKKITSYDKNSVVLNSYAEPTNWELVSSGTIAARLLTTICQNDFRSSASYESERKAQEEDDKKMAAEAEQRERSEKQAAYGFCIANCSSKPGATFLGCLAQCGTVLTR